MASTALSVSSLAMAKSSQAFRAVSILTLCSFAFWSSLDKSERSSSVLSTVLSAAVPRPNTPAVTGASLSETPPAALEMLSSIFLLLLAWLARLCSFCSVAMIWRCSFSYSCRLNSPFLNCSCAFASACLSASSFVLVSVIASLSNRCFCASSSVFLGSSFNSLSTSFNCFCVLLISLLMPPSALDSPVVSPPISTVMPLMLPAIRSPAFCV